jgi:hypothetical protein
MLKRFAVKKIGTQYKRNKDLTYKSTNTTQYNLWVYTEQRKTLLIQQPKWTSKPKWSAKFGRKYLVSTCIPCLLVARTYFRCFQGDPRRHEEVRLVVPLPALGPLSRGAVALVAWGPRAGCDMHSVTQRGGSTVPPRNILCRRKASKRAAIVLCKYIVYLRVYGRKTRLLTPWPTVFGRSWIRTAIKPCIGRFIVFTQSR